MRWAHPRSRGEHHLRNSILPLAAGSSPLTRGAQALAHPRETSLRLIPAHAGSTQESKRKVMLGTAHPRSRGEHCSTSWPPACRGGSSPLTRGARRCDHVPKSGVGLIPAHAGSTLAEQRVKEPYPQFTYDFSEETQNLSIVPQLFSFLFLVCRTNPSGL